MIFRLIVTRACGRCCSQDSYEVDGRTQEKYRKLMKQLITRYMDDIDELGDIDTAMRAQFEQLGIYTRNRCTVYVLLVCVLVGCVIILLN